MKADLRYALKHAERALPHLNKALERLGDSYLFEQLVSDLDALTSNLERWIERAAILRQSLSE